MREVTASPSHGQTRCQDRASRSSQAPHPVEGLPDLLDLRLRDAHASVRDLDHDLSSPKHGRGERDGAFWRELDGVAQQIRQDLVDSSAVALYERLLLWDAVDQLDFGRAERGDHVANLLCDLVQLHLLVADRELAS
eukprot:998084-Rhodomonas_salina.2